MLANFLPTFVLFLREGLEASMIVSILLTSLRQLKMTRYNTSVWLGVGLALLCSFTVAALLKTVSSLFSPDFLSIFKTVTYFIAVVIITWMTFWVQHHSRTLKQELAGQASAASSGFALGLLAFSTVGREGIETAIFTLAFAFQADTQILLLGALLGVLVAIALGVLIYRFGYRLNYRIFFRVMGILLLVMAAGLFSNFIQGAQDAGWITFGTTQVWDTSSIDWLSENKSIIGSLLHIFTGYTENTSILQIVGFVVYLAIAGSFFWRMTRNQKLSLPSATPEQAATLKG
ncbi:FTR1 family iron permease [Ktedonobacter racemifer]|uniref:Iron permease FTR1 n=1 Tax=Ktedonobacter racemifer DSM 44963 TaxID=485913 RepID=D6U519_KTERA|nr:FTR1 family protein [Ktedonobacter racemifer]EFH81599.1 iron permease FTR1 [Ktedonobacter racemifer DSM 44963]